MTAEHRALLVLANVRDTTLAPAREDLPKDDPHDSALWERYIDTLQARARAALTAAGISFVEVCGDRSTLVVRLDARTSTSVYF